MRSDREIAARMIHRSSKRLRTAEPVSTMRLIGVFRECVRSKTVGIRALSATKTKSLRPRAKNEIYDLRSTPPPRYFLKKQGFPVKH